MSMKACTANIKERLDGNATDGVFYSSLNVILVF